MLAWLLTLISHLERKQILDRLAENFARITTPLDIQYCMPRSIAHIPQNRWAWILKHRMEETHKHVRENVKGAMHRQKKYSICSLCSPGRLCGYFFLILSTCITCGLPFRPELILSKCKFVKRYIIRTSTFEQDGKHVELVEKELAEICDCMKEYKNKDPEGE
jgi:hypothetical protein